uniref:Uncharacterized protein n=1 Tax=viral metagenome TaxID=1070528 RepID=A0A6C0K1T9_9ZZZZ
MSFLHLENGREEESIRLMGNGVALVKADCRTQSRLSITQKEKRLYTTTLPLDRQLWRVRNNSTLCLFSAKRSNRPDLVNKGFHYHGTINLIENIHTTSSVNESSEYVHIYSKDIASEFAKNLFRQWRAHLDHVEHAPNRLRHDNPFLQNLENDPTFSIPTMTDHQAMIIDGFRQRAIDNPFYINVGCSRQFGLFAGPPSNCMPRKINGKLGSMSCPVVVFGNKTYKLSVAGCFLLRGIDLPAQCMTRGKATIMRNVARHTVHPEFIEMVRVLCHAV